MTFANAILLVGAGLIAVPIILHLVMRQQPRFYVFPALRFLQQREVANRRRMRFRHWLLLAARCAAIALLALALARPSVPPESADLLATAAAIGGFLIIAGVGLAAAMAYQRSRRVVMGLLGVTSLLAMAGVGALLWWWTAADEGTVGGQEAPVAAALVFDTSPRMLYRHENQTRLEAAQALGLRLLSQLPAESDVAVLNARSDSSAFALDRGAAKKRVESLTVTPAPLPLAQVIDEAVSRLEENALPRKEVYVLTDLARSNWLEEPMRQLARRLRAAAEIQLYVIDVGVEKPANFALGEWRKLRESVAAGAPVELAVEIASIGAAGSRTVELHLYESSPTSATPEPPSLVRGRQTVTLAAGESKEVQFELRGLPPGTHQGYVTLVGEDGLAWDDRRYFTVEVESAYKVLIAGPAPAEDYAVFVKEALAPAALADGRRFDCKVMTLESLGNSELDELSQYAAVCLVDPPPLAPEVWGLVADYARVGGGVALFLGRNARPPEDFCSPAAMSVLPAKTLRMWRDVDRPFRLVTDRASHPILGRLSGADVPWHAFPVFKYWELDAPAAGAQVVVRYNSGHAAVVEHALGKGRVVTMTTSVSDPASDRGAWNVLPTGEQPWPFLALMDGICLHLVGSGGERFNYDAGETAVLKVEPKWPSAVLTTPQGDATSVRIDPLEAKLVTSSTQWPGTYRIDAGGSADRLRRGFSVNSPPAESELRRAERAELDEVLQGTNSQLARTEDEITRNVSRGRVGVKLFPWLAALLALVMAAEHLLATFFYRRREPETGPIQHDFTSTTTAPSVPPASRVKAGVA